ncbi:MAG: ABC transporter permease [Tissierellia bacterium]|nr:ABC transporter permease [Tissierellia bacterium]
MVRYIGQRISIAVVTVFLILLLLFLMLELMPGTPFNDERLTDQQRDVIMEKYGLDRPILERFFKYMQLMLKGDFGISYTLNKNMPVSFMLGQRVGVTMSLGLQAVLLGLAIGMVLGIISALKHGTWLDSAMSMIAVAGVSVPSYVFALFSLYVFAFLLRWFPIRYNPSAPGLSGVLPVISLSMFTIATVARFLRSEMLEVLGSEYILLSRAKGLRESAVISRHGIRNSLIPVVTVVGPLVVNLMTGSLVVEKIFAIPGLGGLFVQAITVNDYNVVIAISFIYSVMFVLVMLAVDILYSVIDPRIRLSKGGPA